MEPISLVRTRGPYNCLSEVIIEKKAHNLINCSRFMVKVSILCELLVHIRLT